MKTPQQKEEKKVTVEGWLTIPTENDRTYMLNDNKLDGDVWATLTYSLPLPKKKKAI